MWRLFSNKIAGKKSIGSFRPRPTSAYGPRPKRGMGQTKWSPLPPPIFPFWLKLPGLAKLTYQKTGHIWSPPNRRTIHIWSTRAIKRYLYVYAISARVPLLIRFVVSKFPLKMLTNFSAMPYYRFKWFFYCYYGPLAGLQLQLSYKGCLDEKSIMNNSYKIRITKSDTKVAKTDVVEN